MSLNQYNVDVTIHTHDMEDAQALTNGFKTAITQIEKDFRDKGMDVDSHMKVTIGDPVQIETCQVLGDKGGRLTDLGDIPLPPESKAKEILRGYGMGDPDDEDSDASLALGAMYDLIAWLKQQGRLK
jgi:hypothetical protein